MLIHLICKIEATYHNCSLGPLLQILSRPDLETPSVYTNLYHSTSSHNIIDNMFLQAFLIC